MRLAAGHNWRPDRGLGRWTGALVATLALHGGAVAAGLAAWQSESPPTPPPAAIMMELAPLPMAPMAAQTQAMPEPRRPEPAPTPISEPEPEREPEPEPVAAAAAPMPPIDPVPPSMREPVVELPKPVPEKPKVAAAIEKPKPKPAEKPKPEKPKPEKATEKPQEKIKEQPKPEAKPDTEPEPVTAQKSMPAPSQQAAAAAAPVQQAAVAAAPSAADIARRASAEANWQGLLLAHLEKHKSYPKSARKRHEEGISFLRFRMDRGGRVLSYALARSSGHRALDDEVLAMIARAQPLPTLPPEMTEGVVEIVVPVQFALR